MAAGGDSPTPARWQRMEALFLQAVDLSVEDRKSFLRAACPDDPVLRMEVEGLLEKDSADGVTLDMIVEKAASSAVADNLVGRRLGVYLVMSEIGRGGMGSVFLASRDDHQFRKQVAIKVIRRGLDTEDVLRRFRHERQILANLDHPNIARLMDGGVTPDGRPYLVMEYVEGQPVHLFCRENQLSLRQKLELFCQICEAVAYAHRNLVVHRDLKPANIVVTAKGKVKLLDFGIAKLLRQDAGFTQTATCATLRMLTPDYASPEQLKGGQVNVATDVYSLGVVLYELLAGKRPHSLRDASPQEMERQICEVEPVKPSQAVEDAAQGEELRGDLDKIVLMAMHKEPLRRYPSVDQLAADVRRYLYLLPVHAREDTLRYRSGKFVRRHKYAVAAASTAVLCLLSGAGVALWQASEARHERVVAETARQNADSERVRAQKEAAAARLARLDVERANADSIAARDEAVHEGKRAKDRLHQMIDLVNKAVFDMAAELAQLPGATEVRKNLASQALRYLDDVCKDAGDDVFVTRSLATAYVQLGDVQGRPNNPSLGDFDAAMRSYRKAEQLNDGLMQRIGRDSSLLYNSVVIQLRIALLSNELGRSGEAVARAEKALQTLLALPEPEASSTKVLKLATEAHDSLSMLHSRARGALSLHHGRMELAYAARLLAFEPDSVELQRQFANSYSRVGSGHLRTGNLSLALANLQQSLALRLKIIESRPRDVQALRDVMLSYGKVGDTLGGPFLSPNMGDDAGALQNYRKAVEYAEIMVKVDPSNRQAESDLAAALLRAGMIPPSTELRRESQAMLERALAILEPQYGRQPNSHRYASDLSATLEFLGLRAGEMGNVAQAIGYYQRSIDVARKAMASDAMFYPARSQVLSSLEGLTMISASTNRRSEALSAAAAALELGRQSSSLSTASTAAHLPKAWEIQGVAYEILARSGSRWSALDWENACDSYRRSAEAFEELLASVPTYASQARTAQARYAACRERLAQATRQR